MDLIIKQLNEIFTDLNERITLLNQERKEEGLFELPKSEIKLLGQTSLLANKKASLVLSLAQTGDLDALLRMEHVVKVELCKLLKQSGLIYDEDSYLIWIPPGSQFDLFIELDHVIVKSIDPESALVSKAIKAPKKNLQLIREAIASEEFPDLVDRILANGGTLEPFV